jgi:16S rRNA C967 or C1407 C5-methylase (RsmB/RsmF family)
LLPLLEAPLAAPADRATLRLSPRRHETDGFFVASLVRPGE